MRPSIFTVVIGSTDRASKRCSNSHGFALIIALSLMAFVLLLVLSISTLLQVETVSSEQAKNQTLARQNAYLGLLTALGELQKSLGPDSRVTARSDIFLGPDGLSEAEIDQRYWMGVWDANNPDGTVKTAADYQAWNALSANEKLTQARWIVSGNEGRDPTDADYWTPLVELPEDGTTVVLAGGAEDYDVEPVRVPKKEIGSHFQRGNFAYWVSDDNAKALVNVVDEDVLYPDPSDTVAEELVKLNRSFQVSHRTGVGAITGIDEYSSEDQSIEHTFDLSTGYAEWISDPAVDISEFSRAHFHDLTTWSKGLLVDVKDGALKRDLTQAFEIHNSFEAHFPKQTFGTQAISDAEAADPMTDEPYFFVEDSLIASGSPNWAILRDYYQHYWPGTKSDWDNMLNFRWAYKNVPGGGTEAKYTPHWHHGVEKSDPYISSGLPYQYAEGDSHNRGDNYQASSYVTPVVAQIRISHALELVTPEEGGAAVPVISFRPVFSLYNPYNIRLGASDFGFISTLNPKITLTLSLSDGVRVVEFYQAELHNANKQGSLKVGLGSFTIGPGEVVHEAFKGNPYGKVESNSGANSDYVKVDWTAVGGLRFALGEIDGIVPEGASTNGAVSFQEAKESGVKENSWHPQWGLTSDEQDWLKQAVAENAPVSVKIEYDSFGSMRSWTNSSAAGQGYHKISDLWRPSSDDQPTTFSTSYGSFSGATVQDSFETLAFSLKTTERMGGASSEHDVIRNLIDLNVRAIHSNSSWDGAVGASRYLSLFDAEALGQNEQEPESYTDADSGAKLGYWGRSIGVDGQRQVVLFDKPRGPLLSIAQLQHANLGRYQFDPTYIVGNSYANVRIPMDQTRVLDFGETPGLTLFDTSYLVNDRLWDGFFFSTLEIPKTEEARSELLLDLENSEVDLSDYTLSSRMQFIDSDLSDAERYQQIVVEDMSDENFETAIYRPASEMWVNGAFNVNSTSVEAWKAILSSSKGLKFPVYDLYLSTDNEMVTAENVVFSRVKRPYNHEFEAGDGSSEDEYWKGYRALTTAEVTDLAESIVDQIKKRGPFLSLASFVNRSLSNGEDGKKGALQAALDDPTLGGDPLLAVNHLAAQHPNLAGEAVVPFTETTNFLSENLSTTDRSSMGFPGYVLQSDILQQIGSFLTVRSDTFTIRSYGDVVNPATNKVTGRAVCEAKVQRLPQPFIVANNGSASDMDEAIKPSSPFGRQFRIVSIKWLEPDQI